MTDKTLSDDTVKTYRYLRLGLVAAVVWLLISVAETSISTQCVQTSLSAFYYTTSHAVFVASLSAIGVMLIAYQGTVLAEEVVLDVAGVLAIVVALVPVTLGPADGGDAEPACGLSLPTDANGAVGSVNNFSSLLVTGAVIVVTYQVVRRRSSATHTSSAAQQAAQAAGWAPRFAKSLLGGGQVAVSAVAVLYLVAGIVWFVAAPDQFKANAHRLAALGLFAGVVVVAIFYASYAALEGKPEAKMYAVIAIFLTVTLIALVVVILGIGGIEPGHAVLWLEIALIVEFAAFWLMQTRDLWHSMRYRPRVTSGRPHRLGTLGEAAQPTPAS
ncbi:hypothetical protein ACTXG5_00440 [Mycobacterium sp. Dal123C01]|uniref:hypothetical protein n=1 Tax=Mycobacterium sp. Dal123C01 TaxID=3457577 RepID=UPI00403EF3BC